MIKIIVAIGSAAIMGAVYVFKGVIYGIAALFAGIQKHQENKRITAQKNIAAPTGMCAGSTQYKIASLQNQINTELELADAYTAKARETKDPVKRAELRKKAMTAECRADTLQDKINTLKASE